MDVTQLSEEAKKMSEYNQPRIEALATGTTKDKEAAQFFGEYQKESSLPGYRAYFRDTKSTLRRGCWTPKGVIASARVMSVPQALDVLGRPTVVSPETYLAAIKEVAYFTINKDTCEAVRNNSSTSTLDGTKMKDHCQEVLTQYFTG